MTNPIPSPAPLSVSPSRLPLLLILFIGSGAAALIYEIVWFQLLQLIIGSSAVSLAVLLGTYMGGLGLGGFLLPRLISVRFNPLRVYAWIEVGIGVLGLAVLFGMPILGRFYMSHTGAGFVGLLMRGLVCAACLILPTLLMGATLPAVARWVEATPQGAPWLGFLYAANTAGAIVGALGFSLILIPRFGTAASQRILIAVAVAAAFFVFWPQHQNEKEISAATGLWKAAGRTAGLTLATILAAFLAWTIPGVPWELIAFGRQLPTKAGQARVLYVGEGLNSSVAVTELDGGARNFHVSGKVEASSVAQDMRLQRLLAHLPSLLHPNPKSVLVVGCGAGVTAGSFVLPPGIERIVICEIEPLIPQVVARYFGRENFNVLDDPRVKVVIDDARHYILTTRETFDIITTDPINPWIKGSAALYSREYYELCRKRLNPGGIIAQWVPLYETTSAAVKSEAATFFSVFPGGTIWSNDFNGLGYDVILLSRDEPATIDVDVLEERIARPGYESVAGSLKEIGFPKAVHLLGTYAGREADLKDWLKDAQINRDRNLRLQYLAGLGSNAYLSYSIYDDLVSHYRFPEDLFTGTPETLETLKTTLALYKKK